MVTGGAAERGWNRAIRARLQHTATAHRPPLTTFRAPEYIPKPAVSLARPKGILDVLDMRATLLKHHPDHIKSVGHPRQRVPIDPG